MPDFNTVLNKSVSDVEKPKPRPVGTYVAVVQGAPKQVTRTVQGSERLILSFQLKLIAPHQVDDQDALRDQGDMANWAPVSHDIWIDSPEGEWSLRRFLIDTLEIDPGPPENSKSLGEMAAEANGKQLLATVSHRGYMSRENQPEIATQIASVAKL